MAANSILDLGEYTHWDYITQPYYEMGRKHGTSNWLVKGRNIKREHGICIQTYCSRMVTGRSAVGKWVSRHGL